ncbi:MAG: right-handed parallel beta-helix repeat-containing protein [Acidobacteria bacterium]|nr:right-handed parallel beta-helix repeat-containing protein [Acidobacteriota bacterium]MBI3658757.1 right-handed parallel beta-helix repeat-containing protein [Acidobacteriota bacterium]
MPLREIKQALWLGFLCAALSVAAPGSVLKVPDEYSTIQQAIDSAEAGDEILVAPGLYQETLTIATDDLRLSGSGAGKTIVDGMGRQVALRLYDAARVRIAGFAFRNASVLVYGYHTSDIILAHNEFQGAILNGVWFDQSRRRPAHQLISNRFLNNQWGVYSLADWGGGEVFYAITGNEFVSNRYGIWLDSTAKFRVDGNLILSSEGIGLLINWNNLGSAVLRNVIVNCGVGLYIVEQDDEFPDAQTAPRRHSVARPTKIYHNTLDQNGIALSLKLPEGFPYDIANNIVTVHGVLGSKEGAA